MPETSQFPQKNSRRDFLKTAFLSVGAAAAGKGSVSAEETESKPACKNPFSSDPLAIRKLTDKVSCTRIGFGTGMASGTELRGLGEEKAGAMVKYCYDKGIRLFDMADTYQTHQIVGKALRGIDRESYVMTSKMWLHQELEKPLDEQLSARDILTRFLQEIGTDYLDVLQMHCMMRPGWEKDFARYMDELDALKEEGLIKSHGVSCHSVEAAKEAVVHPWVDLIHLRFNPFGVRMDGSVEENLEVLKTAQKNGKGTIIMKVAGEGSFGDNEKLRQSIGYIARCDAADVMVVGMATPEQVDFLIDSAAEALKS